MEPGRMYRNKIKAQVELWDRYTSFEQFVDTLARKVAVLEYGDVFMLLGMKKGEVTESMYLKVMIGDHMGWFGCDESTVGDPALWKEYFEELDPKDYE